MSEAYGVILVKLCAQEPSYEKPAQDKEDVHPKSWVQDFKEVTGEDDKNRYSS